MQLASFRWLKSHPLQNLMSKTYAHISLAAGHSKGCEQMHAFRVARGYMIHGAQCINYTEGTSTSQAVTGKHLLNPTPPLYRYYLISQDSTGNQWRNPGVQGDPLCTFPQVGDDYRFLEKINRFSIGFWISMVIVGGSMPHFLINSYAILAGPFQHRHSHSASELLALQWNHAGHAGSGSTDLL